MLTQTPCENVVSIPHCPLLEALLPDSEYHQARSVSTTLMLFDLQDTITVDEFSMLFVHYSSLAPDDTERVLCASMLLNDFKDEISLSLLDDSAVVRLALAFQHHSLTHLPLTFPIESKVEKAGAVDVPQESLKAAESLDYKNREKALWRLQWGSFLVRHLDDRLGNCLYFPSVQAHLNETRLYLDLGFEPSQLVAVEGGTTTARELAAANGRQVGVTVRTTRLEKVLPTLSEGVRVFTYDQIGPYCRGYHETVIDVPLAHDLEGVIAVNVLAARENSQTRSVLSAHRQIRDLPDADVARLRELKFAQRIRPTRHQTRPLGFAVEKAQPEVTHDSSFQSSSLLEQIVEMQGDTFDDKLPTSETRGDADTLLACCVGEAQAFNDGIFREELQSLLHKLNTSELSVSRRDLLTLMRKQLRGAANEVYWALQKEAVKEHGSGREGTEESLLGKFLKLTRQADSIFSPEDPEHHHAYNLMLIEEGLRSLIFELPIPLAIERYSYKTPNSGQTFLSTFLHYEKPTSFYRSWSELGAPLVNLVSELTLREYLGKKPQVRMKTTSVRGDDLQLSFRIVGEKKKHSWRSVESDPSSKAQLFSGQQILQYVTLFAEKAGNKVEYERKPLKAAE